MKDAARISTPIPPPERSVYPWVIAGTIFLAAVLRLLHLGTGFWYDEIVNVQEYLRQPVRDIVTSYAHANHHVLNSLLARVSMTVFGESPWSIRLPAAGFGIAGVWAFWFVSRQIWPRHIAALSTLVLAVSYPHIYYSQSARGYSAFVFFALLATGFALRTCRPGGSRHERRSGVGYAVATALGLYSLPLMAFVALGHGLVLASARRWRPLVWLGAGLLGGLILYVPMLGDVLEYYRSSPTFTGNPLISAAFAREVGRIWPVAIVGAVAGALLLRRLWRRDPLLALLLMVPLVLNLLLPWLRGQGVHPRSFMYVLPLAHLFLAEGLAWSVSIRRSLAPVLAGAIAAASLSALPNYYALPKQGFEEALAYIAREGAPDDAAVGFSMAGKAGHFYDPGVVVVEDDAAFETWLAGQTEAVWIIATFRSQLERDQPRMTQWLDRATEPRAVFDGVIGDGAVYVYWWEPDR